MAKRKRSNEVRIRLNDEEYATYKSRLDQSEMNGNEFGIKALLGVSIVVIPNMVEMIKQVKMLGGNVNQITRAVNFKTQPHANVIEDVRKGMSEIWQSLSRLREVDH